MTDKKLSRLVIFEGPDCGGKSTLMHAAMKLFHGSSYRSVHHGPYSGISADQLPRFYVESMSSLFEGGPTMGMDRCWLSEFIYGTVHRGGVTRIRPPERRQLERMALRHGAVVVLCLPPLEVVKKAWLERKGADSEAEYLDKVEQLEQVWHMYNDLEQMTDLPVVRYDYTVHNHQVSALVNRIQKASTGVHDTEWRRTAGSNDPKAIIVGEKPSNPTSRDAMWQFPFCSFGAGSSIWLTDHLEEWSVRERDLFWVNADAGLYSLKDMWTVPIVALGNEAAERVRKDVGREPFVVNHPAYHRRFKSNEDYGLGRLLKRIMQGE